MAKPVATYGGGIGRALATEGGEASKQRSRGREKFRRGRVSGVGASMRRGEFLMMMEGLDSRNHVAI
jgi:hypothetical protein